MGNRLQIRIYSGGKVLYSCEVSRPVVLGRQDKGEKEPFYVQEISDSGDSRIVVAHFEEQTISRRYLRIEALSNGTARLTNKSATLPFHLPEGKVLWAEESHEVALPAVLGLGRLTVRVEPVEEEAVAIQSLPQVTIPPHKASRGHFPIQSVTTFPVGGTKAFITWLNAVVDVLQSASESVDFCNKAAQAAVELINLDSAHVLMREADNWPVEAAHTPPGVRIDVQWKPSRKMLSRLAQEKRTFYEVPDASASMQMSLRGVKVVVAAPILDRNGEVIAALYGERRQERTLTSVGPITELEASLVELLARGVAAGLARLSQERAALEARKAALEARVRFEQFFTPQLARQLEQHPNLLDGRDEEVSLLFCDIRGFSRISERLGPARTVAWISDTMATLSECVRDHQGVLVDYIGDELIAMWGAPETQPDHARLACRAALDMVAQLPALNERWQKELQETMSFGIGINTGKARVGNMGSPHKFKYGPLGNSVNLASRVQGATKYLKCRLLLTGFTQQHLDSSFQTRYLGAVRVVNIDEPVKLHELSAADRPGWAESRTEYEKALQLFETREFGAAARLLADLRARQPEDGPALVLLYRAIRCLVEDSGKFDPIWELPGK